MADTATSTRMRLGDVIRALRALMRSEVVRRHDAGESVKSIAETLGCERIQVYRWCKKEAE